MFTEIFRKRKINKFQENGGNKKMFGKVFKIGIVIALALICQQARADVLFQDNLENYPNGYSIPLDSSQVGLLSGQKFGDCKAGGPESGSLKVVDEPTYTGTRALQITDGSGSKCQITARVILQLNQGNFVFEVYVRKGSSNGTSTALLLVKDKDTGHSIIADKKMSLTTDYQLFSLPVAINSAQSGHRMQFEIMIPDYELGTTMFADEIKIYTGTLPPPASTPTLTVSPNSGLAGSLANVYGQNFTAGKTAQISFGTIVVVNPVVDSNGTFSASFFVPAVACGVYTVTAKVDGAVIQTTSFTVTATTPPPPEPSIYIVPISGNVGTVVVVSGQNFPSNQNIQLEFDGQVQVNGFITSSGSFTFNLTVPQSASTGVHTITARSADKVRSTTFTVTAPSPPPVKTDEVRITELSNAKKFRVEVVNSDIDAVVTAQIGDQFSLALTQKTPGNYEGVFEETSEAKYTAQVVIKVKKNNITKTITGPEISVDTLLPRFDSFSLSPAKEAYRSGESVLLTARAEAGGTIWFYMPDWTLQVSFTGVGEEYKYAFAMPSNKKDGIYKGTLVLVRNINTPQVKRSLEITIDNTAPSLTVKDYSVKNNKLEISVESDPKAIVKFANGVILTADGKGGFKGSVALSVGQKQVDLKITATDSAGNQAEKVMTFLLVASEAGGVTPTISAEMVTQSVSFKRGVNLFSLIVNIGINQKPCLSQLVEQIGINDLTMIIYLDPNSQKFKSYIYGYPDKIIEKGEGLIVVMKQAKEVVFVGTPWYDPMTGPNLQKWNYVKLVHDLKGQLDQKDFDLIVNGLKELGLLVPERTTLLQNYPNPFNPETWIPYQLAENTNVKINIFDIQGQLVWKIDLGSQSAGEYTVLWDGRDSLGEKVSSGVYFYTLQAGEFTATRKMVIVK